MSSPATTTRPSLGGRRPPMICKRVVLPQPDGPTTHTNSPSPTPNETASRTRSDDPSGVGNAFPTPCTSRRTLTAALERDEEVLGLQRRILVEQSPFLRHVDPELHRIDERRAAERREIDLCGDGGV